MDEVSTTVTAAVIEREGKILICRRRMDQRHPGKWEFPGGKLEAGEQPAECLLRELREELGIEAEIGPEIARYEYRYPGRSLIHLVFFLVRDFEGDLDYSQFDEVRWALPAELPGYDFLEGDVQFIHQLAAGQLLRDEAKNRPS